MLGKIGKAIKVMQGQASTEEMLDLLREYGIDISFDAVKCELAPFERLSKTSSLPQSKMIEIQGRTKGGQTFHGLLVVTEASDGCHRQLEPPSLSSDQ
jgi:hypothetical protein